VDIKQAIRFNISGADMIVNAYLADLSPQELLTRAVPGSNHIAWQLGHLIASERYLINQAVPGKMDDLPEGFADRHSKSTAGIDDPKAFLPKEEYLRIGKQVRANALRILDTLNSSDFDREVTKVPPMCKTVGDTFLFIGPHWMMHAGQWALIRRKLGRPPLF
jgi:hypothetical protein